MSRIYDTFMFRDELDMLEMRLSELDGKVHRHVLVEAATTHRGFPKPLCFEENKSRFKRWQDKIVHLVVELPYRPNPWQREHWQRNKLWEPVDALATDDDVVLICDVDELPSEKLLAWRGPTAVMGNMRTCIHAVDWYAGELPTCVAARAGFIREQASHGRGLAEVRDDRAQYPAMPGAGWHFSWHGGPEEAAKKLDTATCHIELLSNNEGPLIRDGTRYRSEKNGGGLPVVPVDVDETWPAWIYERKCPDVWFRPRNE
jgi:beta-1,4-mannosyl-glycoprotein beta-1,4-N-acetylglucosaminyltransferase